MEDQNNQKSSKISRMSLESIGSSISNFSFLKDIPAPNRQSLRDSLKYYMSVESDRKSDIYQNLISEQIKNKSTHGSGIGKIKPSSGISQQENFRNSYDGKTSGKYFSSDISRQALPSSNISDDPLKELLLKYEIMHTCICTQKCEKNCDCFTSANDRCVFGICCSNCIEFKDKLLSTREKLQKDGCGTFEELKPCTCKKTKCNKKYCSCYAAGKKCTNLCSCDQCTNCQFFQYEPKSKNKQQTYLDMEYQGNIQMPSGMDFQPVMFPEL